MINEFDPEVLLPEGLDDRIEGILREMELSIRWRRPCILFAIYGSEFVRQDVQSDLDNHFFDLGQKTIPLPISDNHNNIVQILDGFDDKAGSIFIVGGSHLVPGTQSAFFSNLNGLREFFIENNIRIIFWLTQNEIIKLARLAPDFWGLRAQVVEFTESPRRNHILTQTLESIWQGTGEYDDQIDDADEKISYRESLLTDLPAGGESSSIRANMLLTLGILHWRKGEYEKAESLLEEAIELSVKLDNKWLEAECLNARAFVYTGMGKVDHAIDSYKQAIRLLPNQIFAWNNLGNLCAKIGRNDEAIVTFSKAVECNPEDSIAWNGLGNVYQAIGYYDDAITSYRKSIQFTSTFAQPWNGLGDVYSIMGRMEDAIAAYERSINISRSYAEPWNGLAKIFLKQDRYRDAIKAYQRILSINERDCRAWNQLGMAQLNTGDLASAEKSFRNAIRVDRTFGRSYNNLGILFAKLDRVEEAITLLTKSLDFLNNEEEQAEIWNELGELYRRVNKYDLAVQAYKNADLKNRGNQLHELEAATVVTVSKTESDLVIAPPQLIEQKMTEETTPGFEHRPNVVEPPAWLKVRESTAPEAGVRETIKGVDMQPDAQTTMNEYELPMEKSGSESKVDAPAWNEIGNEHFRKGNYGEAIISYNKAVQKDPAFGMPYANMGLISLMQGRFSEAILLYNKSAQLLKTNAERAVVYNGLGNSYRAVGDYEKAAVCFRKAAELDPDRSGIQDRMGACQIGESSTSPAFWKELGLAFLENSSFNEALTSLNKAAELDPSDGWIHLNIGKALSFSGKHAEAIAPYARSLDHFKNNKEKAVAMNLMGNAYRKLNNYDKAIECFQRAVVLNDEGVNLVTRARFSLLSNCLAE